MPEYKQNLVLFGAAGNFKHQTAKLLSQKLDLHLCDISALLLYEQEADRSLTLLKLCERLSSYSQSLFVLPEALFEKECLTLLSKNAYLFYLTSPEKELYHRRNAQKKEVTHKALCGILSEMKTAAKKLSATEIQSSDAISAASSILEFLKRM